MSDQPRARRKDRSDLYLKMERMMEQEFQVSNYDPVVRAVMLMERGFRNKEVSVEELAGTHLKVAEYYYAKKRSVPDEGDNTNEERKVELVGRILEFLN